MRRLKATIAVIQKVQTYISPEKEHTFTSALGNIRNVDLGIVTPSHVSVGQQC